MSRDVYVVALSLVFVASSAKSATSSRRRTTTSGPTMTSSRNGDVTSSVPMTTTSLISTTADHIEYDRKSWDGHTVDELPTDDHFKSTFTTTDDDDDASDSKHWQIGSRDDSGDSVSGAIRQPSSGTGSLFSRKKGAPSGGWSAKQRQNQQPQPGFPGDSSVAKRSECNRSSEYCIKQRLFRSNYAYDETSRPVHNDDSTVMLYVGMSLYHILDTNEKYQTLSSLVAVRLRWVDEYLRWNASEFGGVDQIWVPAMDIWTPDIFISNFVDNSFRECMNTNVIVTSDGSVLWMFPAVVKTYCTLDVRHFPFDEQRCSLVFISWTFNGNKLNVTFNESEHQAIYYTPRNQEWFVEKVSVERNEKVYACCPEPYPDVSFTIHMKRRSLFYVINLIFPCLLIYAVSFLGFFLPVESGEKINLETTILLALVVFLLIVGETLPPTPDVIPVLGILFGLTMIMVSIALVMAVVVTNIFMRKDTDDVMPNYLRRIFIRRRKRRLSEAIPLPSLAMLSTAAPKRKKNASAAVNNTQQQTRGQQLSSSSENHYGAELAGTESKEYESTKLSTVSGSGFTESMEMDADSLSMLSRLDSYRKSMEAGDFVTAIDQSADGNDRSGVMGRGPWSVAADSTSSTVRIRMVNPYPRPKKPACRQLSSYRSQRGTGANPTVVPNSGGAGGSTGVDQRGPVEQGGTLTKEQLESRLEWQELARAVDRLFFWLFMISSVALLAVLIYVIVDR